MRQRRAALSRIGSGHYVEDCTTNEDRTLAMIGGFTEETDKILLTEKS